MIWTCRRYLAFLTQAAVAKRRMCIPVAWTIVGGAPLHEVLCAAHSHLICRTNGRAEVVTYGASAGSVHNTEVAIRSKNSATGMSQSG